MKSKSTYQPKTRTFLYDMVTAEFFPYRNARMGSDADEMVEQINKALKTKEGDDDFRINTLCTLLAYTQRLTFNWLPDAPAEWHALETLWQMWHTKRPVHECWEYVYSDQFDISLIYGFIPSDADRAAGVPEMTGWLTAYNSAMRPWSPVTTRPEAQLTLEEKADPN